MCVVSRRRTTARIPTRKSSQFSTPNSVWSHPCGPPTSRGSTAWVVRRTTAISGTTRTRPIIVRFVSERVRDSVYRARTRLKGHDIYLNEDLTARRAKLAYDARQLKKAKKIVDCWSSYGKVIVKDSNNKIREIKSPSDLLNI